MASVMSDQDLGGSKPNNLILQSPVLGCLANERYLRFFPQSSMGSFKAAIAVFVK